MSKRFKLVAGTNQFLYFLEADSVIAYYLQSDLYLKFPYLLIIV